MKFKSKTALLEHILELEEAGYLTHSWLRTPLPNGKTRMSKVFKINFDKVKRT